MRKKRVFWIGNIVGLILISLAGCQLWKKEHRTPTHPNGNSSPVSNYAHMPNGSRVIDGQQLNWYVSQWGSFPYGQWMYLEVNQQDAVGYPPGEHQVAVTLRNVVLTFNELPDDITQIIIGVKAMHDDTDETFYECGRFDVVNGSVRIPLAYEDLVSFFGIMQYSIWFQAVGGDNGEGTICGQIALSGNMPNGQSVTLRTQRCFGTPPAATATPVPTPTPVPPPPPPFNP
jgi:hypothetical protein